MVKDPAVWAMYGPPPAGIHLSDDIRHDERAVQGVICVAVVTVVLRVATRVVTKHRLGADDWTIIAALVITVASTIILVEGSKTGTRKHVWVVSVDQVVQIYRLLFFYYVVYVGACLLTRISILLFYRRIFTPLEPLMKAALLFTIFITVSYSIVMWVTLCAGCRPVSYFWSWDYTDVPGGTCINFNRFFLAGGAINIFNEVIILLIPFPRIIMLHMSIRKKLSILAIMALGIFVCVASVMRIWFIYLGTIDPDMTRAMSRIFIWSTIEPAVAIVTASLPHLAPLVKMTHTRLSKCRSYNSSTEATQRQRYNLSSRGWRPTFDFGFDAIMASHDEIGLTNYVQGVSMDGRQQSITSNSKDGNFDNSIVVESTLVQTTSISKGF